MCRQNTYTYKIESIKLWKKKKRQKKKDACCAEAGEVAQWLELSLQRLQCHQCHLLDFTGTTYIWCTDICAGKTHIHIKTSKSKDMKGTMLWRIHQRRLHRHGFKPIARQ